MYELSVGMYHPVCTTFHMSVSDSPHLSVFAFGLCVSRVFEVASVCGLSVCLSPLTFPLCLTTVIQAIPPLSQWKNAGHGASQPGRQLGSPSVALKTCYPPECIRLA